MISESLLEFEESLADMSSWSNTLMLNNLDLKVDLNRFQSVSCSEQSRNVPELSQLFADYDYASDEATVCEKCRHRLSQSSAPCCLDSIKTAAQGFSSAVENDYWHSFLENPYKTIMTLPNYTKLSFFQTGIPFQLRPVVWQKMISVNQKNLTSVPEETIALFRNFQHSYNREISIQIKKDLGRTFPELQFFKNEKTINSLLTILNVYANYDLELGYCQGLLFLVGTLYHQFKDSELTFHSLCKIMECEPELRSIFVPATMSSMLEKWYAEFFTILTSIDRELAHHLVSFCDCKVFMYQWWLSGSLIHAPEFFVNNRIVDLCLMEGWKVGIFKISLGLILRNRPILMSFGEGDEEVIYQHLLNESKWGNIINNITEFFGEDLLAWDESLFSGFDTKNAMSSLCVPKEAKNTHRRTTSTVLGMLKTFSIASGSKSRNANAENAQFSSTDSLSPQDRSSTSLFSTSRDNESIYSAATSFSWDRHSKGSGRKNSVSSSSTQGELALENETLRNLLRRAYAQLDNESLKSEIREAIDV